MNISAARERTRRINETCACTSLDRGVLGRSLSTRLGEAAVARLPETHPHLFADAPVYLCRADLEAMERLVTAVEALAATPGYQDAILGPVPRRDVCRDFGPRGALMGYDFHLTDAGPRLIEINTNAGGAFLNAVACDAQRVCCEAVRRVGQIACPPDLSAQLVAMFVEEWRLQRGGGSPRTVAIVDDDPDQQYLYPEFVLARGLLEAHGIRTVIADPRDLAYRDGALWHGGDPVDLVYNRLVDFDLSEQRHAALRRAYLADATVVTPNPFHHALLADKRNLVALYDPSALRRLGVPETDLDVFEAVPTTRPVNRESADAMWAERAQLFFKPLAGHGGKAVYRGDKLTRKVWNAILEGAYVAQARIAPGERRVAQPGGSVQHKMDVRLYTYRGQTLLAAARLYQGQTTNFRTPGGGFAPVMIV